MLVRALKSQLHSVSRSAPITSIINIVIEKINREEETSTAQHKELHNVATAETRSTAEMASQTDSTAQASSNTSTNQATGKDIGRTTHDQLNNGLASIKETDKQIGDLGYRGNNHVVMYVGNNKIVEAPTSGGTVSYRTLTDKDNFDWKRP